VYDLIKNIADTARTLIVKALAKTISDSTAIQLVRAIALSGEVFEEVERIQEYGLSSVPPVDSETVIVQICGIKDNPVVLKIDSAKYRPTGSKNGEVIMYSMHGQKIKLDENGNTIFNDGSNGVARINHEITSNIVIDETFFTFLTAVATALSLTAPTTLTGKISQGSAKVKIDD
jgi:phage baseplate assembly protein V